MEKTVLWRVATLLLAVVLCCALVGCGAKEAEVEAPAYATQPMSGVFWGCTPEEMWSALGLPEGELDGYGSNWATVTLTDVEVYGIRAEEAVCMFNLAHLRDKLYPSPEEGGVYRLGQITLKGADSTLAAEKLTALLGVPVDGDLSGQPVAEGGEVLSHVWMSTETTETAYTEYQKEWKTAINDGLREMGMPESLISSGPSPMLRIYSRLSTPDEITISSAAQMYAYCADLAETGAAG